MMGVESGLVVEAVAMNVVLRRKKMVKGSMHFLLKLSVLKDCRDL